MSSAILLMVVVSVTSAITAGQQHAFEAQQRIAAVLAAEDLMGRLLTAQYADLSSWNTYIENVGAMTDISGASMPQVFDSLGRDVSVTTATKVASLPDVVVRGVDIQVTAFDAEGRILVDLNRFIAEPAADSIPDEGGPMVLIQ